MIEKIKDKIEKTKENYRNKREERERINKERIEEEIRIKCEQIQAEKNELMALSEKELMVEGIMALRGYNTRLTLIEERHSKLLNNIEYLESRVSSLETHNPD